MIKKFFLGIGLTVFTTIVLQLLLIIFVGNVEDDAKVLILCLSFTGGMLLTIGNLIYEKLEG